MGQVGQRFHVHRFHAAHVSVLPLSLALEEQGIIFFRTFMSKIST